MLVKFSTILIVLAFLAGCGSETTIKSTDKTHGQELLDLKEAYDQGAITKEEYEDAKEEILDKI